jgi:hypothetical protein
MSIIKRHRTGSYSVMANHCLRNKLLSAKAKGIFAYIMSLPEDWKLYRTELTNHFTDGKDSIRSGFDELVKFGYIVATELRDEAGRMSGWGYDIYEEPHAENPIADNPPSDRPPLLSTNIQQSTNNNKYSGASKPDEPSLLKPSSARKSGEKKVFVPPAIADVELWAGVWAAQHGKDQYGCKAVAKQAFDYYQRMDWVKANDKKVNDWKRTIAGVWFTDSKLTGRTGNGRPPQKEQPARAVFTV